MSTEPEPTLTEREQAVLRQTVLGFSSREIGTMLGISPKTVDTYRARTMKKLNMSHRSDLVRYAIDVGFMQRSMSP